MCHLSIKGHMNYSKSRQMTILISSFNCCQKIEIANRSPLIMWQWEKMAKGANRLGFRFVCTCRASTEKGMSTSASDRRSLPFCFCVAAADCVPSQGRLQDGAQKRQAQSIGIAQSGGMIWCLFPRLSVPKARMRALISLVDSLLWPSTIRAWSDIC